GALAVDTGYLYMVRASFQRAADAAVLAGASGLVTSQQEASSRATTFANLNLATQAGLNGAPTVTFPTDTTIRVTITDPAVRLYFGGAVGIPTASVSASAAAGLSAAASVNGNAVPLAIYCNNPTGCEGVLAVGQTHSSRRYCGNFFNGNSEVCGNTISTGEIFVVGVTWWGNNSNSRFRNFTYSGYDGTLGIGDVVRALPGNRNGWRRGMSDRLSEGRNKMIFSIVRPAGDDDDERALQIRDFVEVRVDDFSRVGNTDGMTFEIIRVVVSTEDFATDGQGLGINSISGVRLSE
ncbi:MAG: pilus assembly protein TadG-related protein, partial [Nitrospinota bacterium]